ncbi:MAG: hypothetical protein ACTSWX_12780 [Promethearchaeota archaeon]
MSKVKKTTSQNVKKKTYKKTTSYRKNIKGKKTSTKIVKKKSTSSKKSGKKMENLAENKQKKPDIAKTQNIKKSSSQTQIQKSSKHEKIVDKKSIHSPEFKDKESLVARHLLRLYQFIKQNDPINEQKLLEEMDLGTPNEELRQKVTQLEFELEGTSEENQALRQNALQIQIEAEEQIESIEFENKELKEKVNEINDYVKAELEKRSKRFEVIIEDLRSRLRDALEKNEKITEVNERIEYMQKQVSLLFDQNEKLNKTNNDLEIEIANLNENYEAAKETIKTLEHKNKELHKKVDLQKMVIDGYKRKEAKLKN